MAALFAGVGLSSTAFIMMAAVVPLVAQTLLESTGELLGSGWSGLPSAIAIAGTAVGTGWLTSVMSKHGRRRGLLLGYLTAAIAAGVASVAVGSAIFALLLVAVFAFGIGFSATQLSRYAAADLYEDEHKARAIGRVVWAGTIGSVLGPNLLRPAERLGEALGMPELTGPILLASLTMGLAGLVLLVAFPSDAPSASFETPKTHRSLSHLVQAKSQVALAALVIGQVVMILIMTMTPIHLRDSGGDLGAIGVVMAAHTLGMYALSPFSSYLSDRFGRRPIILLAGAFLVAAALLASRARGDASLIAPGLFFLGWGWNLGFVSGSALLTEAVRDEHRLHMQGFADSVVWASASSAAAASGMVLHSFGYGALCHLGLTLALVPATIIVFRRW